MTISAIDSQAFPHVAAYVAVSGEDGRPISGLTEADFDLSEDGTEVEAESLTVEENVRQDLRLVLALDTSVPADALVNIKAAATALIETMQAQDKVALLTFADTVTTVRDFTNNRIDLQAAVSGLSREGDYTVLHEAAAEAVNLAGKMTEGRPAVIIITDSRDNLGTLTAANFVEAAQQNQVPLTFIGFGSKIRPADLEVLAKPTRGQAISLAGPTEIEETLLEVVQLLREGYRITFTSKLQADNAKHRLAVRVKGEGQVEGSFMAIPSQVTVTLPTFTAGQTVGGRIQLTAQTTAPAPLRAVEYLVDGQTLAIVDVPPYSWEWDSATVKPGPHILTARAIDLAGNEGQAEVALNVVPPLVVRVTTSTPKVKLGDRVPMQAQIEALNPIARVEFLLDGVRVGESTTPPYSFAFDSAQYPVGLHVMSVRVEDTLGQTAEDSFSVEFLALPPPPPNWTELLIRLALVVLVLLLAVVASLFVLFLLRLIIAWQKRRCQRRLQVEVVNQGNIAGRYGVWASDTAGLLKFQFKLNGALLPMWSPAPMVSEPEPVYAEAPHPMESVSAAGPSQTSRPANPVGASQIFNPLTTAQQAGDRAMGAGAVVADILGTVGALLPGSLGAPLRNSATQIRNTQRNVGQMARAPGQMISSVERVQRKASSLAPGLASSAAPTAAARPGQTAPVKPVTASLVVPARPVSLPVTAPAKAKTQTRPLGPANGPTWIETPVVAAGQSLTCDLLIDPDHHYRSREYEFTIKSVSLDQAQVPPLVEEGEVYIRGISWFGRLWPLLLATAAIAGIVLLAGYAIVWLAGSDLATWPFIGKFVAALLFVVHPYPSPALSDM